MNRNPHPKPDAPREILLREFAETVLRILEDDDSWSADTLERIAQKAYVLHLAELDSQFYFRATKDHE